MINKLKMNEYIQVLKSKIHRAEVTEAQLDYFGSITIDEELLKASGIHPFEKVLVTNMREGSRLETYTLKGPAGSGVICLNGPSAHFFQKGDEVLIMAFKMIPESEAVNHQPTVIFPKNQNKTWITKENEYH
jgi:aspartate 1-decarboxylase